MKIEIDSNSGFCFGVVNAIQLAEMELDRNKTLYCLGDIVHNSAEVERLKKKGLVTIDHKQFKTLKNCKVLLRAHGEPPETYETAIKNNIQLIDASCPVVLKLQNNIKLGFDAILKKGGQVVIYGKKGHAEVNGLVGQTNNKAIVIGEIEDLDNIDFTKPINLFSQTTKNIEGFYKIQDEIKKRMVATQGKEALNTNLQDKKALLQILHIGTSAGGARAKALIAINKLTGDIKSGQFHHNSDYEYYLIKIDGANKKELSEPSGFGRLEYTYSQMAKDCDIHMIVQMNG